MFELSTALGFYQTQLLDHTNAPKESLERNFFEIRNGTRELNKILTNPELAAEKFAKLKTSIEAVYRELSRTLPIRRLVFTGSSGQLLQDLLLSHQRAQEEHPLAVKRLQKPLMITGDQNKRIKHQLGVTTLIPPLSIIIEDFAESMSKAELYLPEVFPGRSMFVLAMNPTEKLGFAAKSALQRFTLEQRFKVGLVDTDFTNFMKLIAGLESDIVSIQTGSEYWKSVKDFDYRWDKSKLTPEQAADVAAAETALKTLRAQVKNYLSSRD